MRRLLELGRHRDLPVGKPQHVAAASEGTHEAEDRDARASAGPFDRASGAQRARTRRRVPSRSEACSLRPLGHGRTRSPSMTVRALLRLQLLEHRLPLYEQRVDPRIAPPPPRTSGSGRTGPTKVRTRTTPHPRARSADAGPLTVSSRAACLRRLVASDGAAAGAVPYAGGHRARDGHGRDTGAGGRRSAGRRTHRHANRGGRWALGGSDACPGQRRALVDGHSAARATQRTRRPPTGRCREPRDEVMDEERCATLSPHARPRTQSAGPSRSMGGTSTRRARTSF